MTIFTDFSDFLGITCDLFQAISKLTSEYLPKKVRKIGNKANIV